MAVPSPQPISHRIFCDWYMNEPRSLKDAVVYFSNPDNCLNYLVKRRWSNGVREKEL
jgi:hypothetical protein